MQVFCKKQFLHKDFLSKKENTGFVTSRGTLHVQKVPQQ
eukprot:UN08604